MNPPIAYLFYVMTTRGRVRVDFPPTPFEGGDVPDVTGDAGGIAELTHLLGITTGVRGQLLSLKAISPLDLDFALEKLQLPVTMAGPRYPVPPDLDKLIEEDPMNDVDLAEEED